ncbi:MAG: hypothetical protein OEL57_15380, partial [Trichlorobacter sp.]|uniref:hypothetical protein n=1 Tax=Trichlorobacter sp. TaxID=2911007 RepID=UPI00255DB9FC
TRKGPAPKADTAVINSVSTTNRYRFIVPPQDRVYAKAGGVCHIPRRASTEKGGAEIGAAFG